MGQQQKKGRCTGLSQNALELVNVNLRSLHAATDDWTVSSNGLHIPWQSDAQLAGTSSKGSRIPFGDRRRSWLICRHKPPRSRESVLSSWTCTSPPHWTSFVHACICASPDPSTSMELKDFLLLCVQEHEQPLSFRFPTKLEHLSLTPVQSHRHRAHI